MSSFLTSLYRFAIVLWVGGMLAVGYVVAPTLFAELSDRMLAGNLAGAVFFWMARIGLACGAYLLVFLLIRQGWRVVKSLPFWLVLIMVLLVAAGHFGIQPLMAQLKQDALPRDVMQSVFRDRFATWHGVASVVYLIQSLLGVILVFVQDRGLQAAAAAKMSKVRRGRQQ